MKALITILTLTVSLSVSGLALVREANPTNNSLEHTQACPPSVIRIEQTYLRQDGATTYRGSAFSLGTAIAPNIVLTHNHFYKTPEWLQNKGLTLFDTTHAIASLTGANMPFVPVDGGTALIYIRRTVSLPNIPTSDRSTLEHLAAGDRLTVCYWNDTRSRLNQQDFEIVGIQDSIATLADPDRAINPGDSGGGAFFDGRLVGNTWSINTDPNGSPLGTFSVALLPAQVADLISPASTGAASDAIKILPDAVTVPAHGGSY